MKKNQKSKIKEADPEDFKILADHGYADVEFIGKGGYSRVYKGLCLKYKKVFAIKVVDSNLPGKKMVKESIQNEFNTLQKLYHPNIIQMFDTFVENEKAFFVIEYCKNGSVRHVNKEHPGVVSQQLLEYFWEILNALAFVHRKKYAHSDIKTENILLDDYNRPKLADFGMAEHYEEGQFSSIYKGSPQYASPEIHSHTPYDPFKSDIWSLGISFYEMIMDHLPWPKQKELISSAIAEGGCVIPRTLPMPVQNLLRAMTNINPAHRLSAEELLKMKVFDFKNEKRIPLQMQRNKSGMSLMNSSNWLLLQRKKSNIFVNPTMVAPKADH